jgi:hypothetical protein
MATKDNKKQHRTTGVTKSDGAFELNAASDTQSGALTSEDQRFVTTSHPGEFRKKPLLGLLPAAEQPRGRGGSQEDEAAEALTDIPSENFISKAAHGYCPEHDRAKSMDQSNIASTAPVPGNE